MYYVLQMKSCVASAVFFLFFSCAFLPSSFAIFGLPGSNVPSLSHQVEGVIENVRSKATDLDKFIYLREVATTNSDLYYASLINNVEELMPIVYTPTVGAACLNHSTITTPSPKPTPATGLYVTIDDLGSVREGEIYIIYIYIRIQGKEPG